MSKIKTLKNVDVKNKRVLVRVDFDVPMDDKLNIVDNSRIKGCLSTFEYLIKQKAKIILISHTGRPNGKKDKKLSLKSIVGELGKLLNKKILFSSEIFGVKVKEKIKKMKFGDILLLENIRFWKQEEQNDQEFAKKIAELGDIYINESFAVSHRKHASIVGIPQFLPSVAGFLLEKEIEELDKILKKPMKPLVAIIGGAKIETKIKVINKFLKIADKVLIGGALANTIFASQGIAMGESKIDKESFGEVKKINLKNHKLFLPIDLGIWDGKNVIYRDVGSLQWFEKALDIGPKTIHLFNDIILKSKMVVWNGPLGLIGQKPFDRASKELIGVIDKGGIYAVVGGGDTNAFINEIGKKEIFNWVSTGGGAMLDYLSEGTLPGIEALRE
ncbi:MAG TPA: phosphoglycerate kinase [Candidatus Portnoybacteria bacterium]|jgi:phosphoglycerate kinase|nr:phosphoglycerate kinase [Candidatus Portnoybacteria bacterium]MDD5751927.1 phosphoglycerate kinase [Candidatus Portnoybacteria bacterium]HNU96688.1 phosphoglycerate kinase [Candidatus Portnoybacteria bacterium]HOZ16269.1 phosphoglycerate kinase [Candidatus Portnoybacteria bacterium]HPH51935.1 phosphoglycerate kinase [Candidatus Portnoybacteria bacterium]